ncbi:hypothetical protein Pcinc_028397 [Petrolisthes cinctipes]|uniref:Uncharacterized protein n=1 Tax=Petrolisthes cinctipes TaxID=88211 RepID=A0AAE1F1Y7_PETCI|nr:hypothetical protein Pcinc_028397 [Petrolisthes cinctipes]
MKSSPACQQIAGKDSIATGGDRRYSPCQPRHPLLPSPLTSNKSPITPLDPSTALVSTPSPSALTATALPAPGPTAQALPPPPPPLPARNGSRCIMVEIEMDTLARNAVSPTSASNPDIASPLIHGGQHQQRHQGQPIRTTSQLFPKYNGPEHQNGVQLTSFTQHPLYPPPLLSQQNSRQPTDIPARARKLSADSGVFLEGRHRRRQQTSQAEAD